MTTRQLGLFDAPHRNVRPADPNVRPVERPRLGLQSRAILSMLRERPRSGGELAAITHRFGGRLYDLRRAGCAIDTAYDPASGAAVYTLNHEPEGL